MSKGLIKLIDPLDQKEYYLEWNIYVGAPYSNGFTLKELEIYIKEEYGNQGLRDLPFHLSRIEKWGTSFRVSAAELIEGNYAGDNGSELDYEGLLNKYCRMQHAD